MKKILVTTDASEYSKRALTTALELARKFNAEIELLNVMYTPVMDGASFEGYRIPPELIEQQGEQTLDATLEGVDISDVALVKKKIHGEPAKVILKEVENENIDLVVMGSHGYGAIVGSLLGSVSQKVLHDAKRSVLIVK